MEEIYKIFLIILSIATGFGQDQIWYNEDTANSWTKMENKFKVVINNFLDNAKVLVEKTDFNFSTNCKNDLKLYIRDLRQLKTWAVMMLDATSKFPNGILEGGFADLGAYDQCVGIFHAKDSGQAIKGQYCTLHIYPPLPRKPRFYPIYQHIKELKQFTDRQTVIGHLSQIAQFFYSEPFRWSICLPSTCLTQDVQQLANIITPYTELIPEVTNCEIKETFQLSKDQICALTMLGALFFVTIIGSCLDSYLSKKNNEIKALGTWRDPRLKSIRILRCFSVISNGKKILDVSNSEGIPVLHGIRVFTMLWIILCHTYLYNNITLFGNIKYFRNSVKELWFQMISNGTLSVDTFYFLSGILTSFITIKTMKEQMTFNIPLFLFHRFWRLTPAYMLVICLTLLLPLFGSGPVWKECIFSLAEDCKNYWWTNLLYLNNIIVPNHQCLPHSWFLPVDMQFHFLSILFFLPIFSGRIRLAKFLIISLTIIGAIICSIVTYVNDYPPTELHVHPDGEARMEMKSDVYFTVYPHAGAYCIGLLLGYKLLKNRTSSINKVTLIIGWCLSTICALVVLLGVHDWNKGNVPSSFVSALYAAFHRTAWTGAIAWIVIVCESGQAGIINRFLCWKVLIPFSRLTYLAFLLHPFMLWTFVGLTRERLYYSHYYVLYRYITHTILSYGTAFIFSILFESPFCALEKIIFRRNDKVYINEMKNMSNEKQKSIKQFFQNGHARNVGD